MCRAMGRKSILCSALLIVLLSAAACAPAPNTVAAPATPLAQSTPLPPGTVVASGVIVPAQESQLSFLIAGTVKDLEVSEGDVIQAGQNLMTLNAPELEFAVARAEAAAHAAELRYQYWIPARLDRPPERRILAQQQFVAVQKSLDTARAELTQATLSAPFAGTVVDLKVEPGELVQPGQVVLTIAALDHLRVETTDLSERDLPGLKIGQKATIFVEALDEDLSGTVTAISPIANTVGGDVVYKVTVELDAAAESLRWGMTAEVHIETE